jgi:hypothetical protein
MFVLFLLEKDNIAFCFLKVHSTELLMITSLALFIVLSSYYCHIMVSSTTKAGSGNQSVCFQIKLVRAVMSLAFMALMELYIDCWDRTCMIGCEASSQFLLGILPEPYF